MEGRGPTGQSGQCALQMHFLYIIEHINQTLREMEFAFSVDVEFLLQNFCVSVHEGQVCENIVYEVQWNEVQFDANTQRIL